MRLTAGKTLDPLGTSLPSAAQHPESTGQNELASLSLSKGITRRSLTSQIQPGSVLELSDGTRHLVLRVNEATFDCVSRNGNKVNLSTLHAEILDGSRSLKVVENREQPELIRGILHHAPLEAPRWHHLRSGAILEHKDGAREEILTIREIFNTNDQNKLVESIRTTPDGVITFQNQRRSDRELAGPSAPLVFEKVEIDPKTLGQVNSQRHTTQRGPLAEVYGEIEREIEAIKFTLATQAQKISDQAFTNYRQRARSVEQPNQFQFERLELVLSGLKEVHLLGTNLKTALTLAGGHVEIEALLGKTTKLSEAKSTLERIPLDESTPLALITSATKRWHAVADIIAPENKGNYRPTAAINSFSQTAAALSGLLDEASAFSQTATSHTVFELPGKVGSGVFETVSQLAADTSHDHKRLAVSRNGVIIEDYYTPDYLRRMVDAGGRLITHRDLNPQSKNFEITGFVLYYNPGKVPPEAKGIPDYFRTEPSAACFDLICVSPKASLGAYQRLMDAQLVHLQNTDAMTTVAEQLVTNFVAFKLSTKQGTWLNPRFLTQGKAPDGSTTSWVCVEEPVHPALRATLLPPLRQSADTLIKGFKLQAESRATTIPEVIVTDPERAAELKKVRDVAHYLRREATTPIITRISMGAANMTADEFNSARGILENGLQGAKGVITWGASMMLTLIDGEISGTPRGGAYESLKQIKQRATEEAIFLGVTVFNPDESREVVVPHFNGGKPIFVVKRESSGNFVTVEDINVDQSVRFPAKDAPGKPFWDQEALRSREVARELGRDTLPLPGILSGPFRNIAIFVSGGGTIGREIKALAEEAHDFPDRDIHVVLVDSRTQSAGKTQRDPSSTERYADDAAWLDRHTMRAVETGRAPYVHVVRSAGELLSLMHELNAVAPIESESLPSPRLPELEVKV